MSQGPATAFKPKRDWLHIGDSRPLPDLLAAVAAEYEVPTHLLYGPCQRRRAAWPRQDFMWRAYRSGCHSLSAIGDFLGRDHTTIAHGVRAHAARIGAQSRRSVA